MIVCVLTLGGLCNRMRTMTSVVDLAHRLQQKPVFVWVRMPDMNASFTSLFKDFPATVISVRARGAVFKTLDFLKEHWCDECVDDDFVHAYCKDKLSANLQMLRGKNLLVHTCENITRTDDFSMFKAVSLPLLANKDCIGVHIRRTDNDESRTYSPTALFVERMQREVEKNSQVKFYLATDDPAEEKTIVNCFPGRVLSYVKRSLDRNNPQAIEDALIDLVNLSHCSKILASYFSSFSDVAASWGRIEKIVVSDKNSR